MIGDSGGRSGRHRTGKGAGARSTARQRAAIDPPPTTSWDRLEEPGLHEPGESTLQKVWVYSLVALVLSAWVVGLIVIGVNLAL